MDVNILASSGSFSAKNNAVVPSAIVRRSANFHPSVWGDHFLAYTSSDLLTTDADTEKQFQQLKEQVKKMILAAADEPQQQLNLIDDIQRLGVAYHFQAEIDTALHHLNATFDSEKHGDLHTLALCFRLLRQNGYNVSSDVFRKFKNNNGEFKEYITKDVRGMLSLYEATHFMVHGEDILEEALAFTISHLEHLKSNLTNHPLARQVIHGLNRSIHKGINRLEARHYISIYHELDDSHNELLLNFAKLDFNLLQKVHQGELSYITRWWKDLNFAEKLPFARDRLVECYFWILGVYFEPEYLLARRILTKVIAISSIMDDIYDVYGTFKELVLFTDAIERWDINALDQLPEYMKVCYRALLDVYSEMEEELAMAGRPSYGVRYAKDEMKRLVRSYFDEAKWFNEGYIPTLEEYLKVALVSAGFIMVETTSFVGMRDLATREAFEWVSNNPLLVRASSIIARLADDMAGHEIHPLFLLRMTNPKLMNPLFLKNLSDLVEGKEPLKNLNPPSRKQILKAIRKQFQTQFHKQTLHPTLVLYLLNPIKRSLLDIPLHDRAKVLRAKKLRTKITPLTADELRVPSSSTNIPPIVPAEIQVPDDELVESIPVLSRKRKQPSDSHPGSSSAPSSVHEPNPVRSPSPENIYVDPSIIRNQSMPSPPRQSTSEFQHDAMASPTMWPRFNANFPFQLFDAFVRETDDHRFGNSSNGDLLNEGMSYLAKANAVFGRLCPKSIEAEAKEEAMKKENVILKSALARERTQRESILHTNEGLRKELAQAKGDVKTSNEELKSTKAQYEEIVKMNVDLVQRSEIRMEKIKELKADANILTKTIQKLELAETRHLNKCQKLEEEIRELKALRDLGPPLTDDLLKQICEEYRNSDKINVEIMKIYSESYELCRSRGKEKLITANVDPTLLDSSDGEDDA